MIPVFLMLRGKCEEAWKLAEPYHPEDFFPALLGLAMVFFGGDFPVLIAAVTAFRETGVKDSMVSAFGDIMKEFNEVLEKSKKDDLKDDNNDGIPDVEQIPAAEVAKRKLILAAKTVNPDKLAKAVTSVSAGY
jgi:hypothetical protein